MQPNLIIKIIGGELWKTKLDDKNYDANRSMHTIRYNISQKYHFQDLSSILTWELIRTKIPSARLY
jgi:hypothetical protein